MIKKAFVILIIVLLVSCVSACGSEANTQSSPRENTSEIVEDDVIDYDLTQMSSSLVYALVFDMMSRPDEYIGKTIKLNGEYYSQTSIDDIEYHYVIVADATACCAQGLEFASLDESIEMPSQSSQIEIVGVFQMYKIGKSEYYHVLADNIAF